MTTIHRPLCRPLPAKVRMGSVPVTDFSNGQYSGSRERAFQLSLDCDAGVGDVRFVLEPTAESPAVDIERGIVGVSGGATGVGLQVLEGDKGSTPLALEKSHLFGSTVQPGLLSRRFLARYVQTVKDRRNIQVGKADASIRIVMDYP
ncbi:fimbrial protein [Stenotrophomonas riyadhensis]